MDFDLRDLFIEKPLVHFGFLTVVALVVKNSPASGGEVRDVGLIPGREDPLEEGTATHSSVLAWRIPWKRSLAGYSP